MNNNDRFTNSVTPEYVNAAFITGNVPPPAKKNVLGIISIVLTGIIFILTVTLLVFGFIHLEFNHGQAVRDFVFAVFGIVITLVMALISPSSSMVAANLGKARAVISLVGNSICTALMILMVVISISEGLEAPEVYYQNDSFDEDVAYEENVEDTDIAVDDDKIANSYNTRDIEGTWIISQIIDPISGVDVKDIAPYPYYIGFSFNNGIAGVGIIYGYNNENVVNCNYRYTGVKGGYPIYTITDTNGEKMDLVYIPEENMIMYLTNDYTYIYTSLMV